MKSFLLSGHKHRTLPSSAKKHAYCFLRKISNHVGIDRYPVAKGGKLFIKLLLPPEKYFVQQIIEIYLIRVVVAET